MKKIFTYDKYKFNLYDISTSIIYNDDKIKKKILSFMSLDDYNYINSDVTMYNISVKKYLELNEFKMNMIPLFDLEPVLNKRLSSLDLPTVIYLKIITSIINSNEIVIFDDVLSYLSDHYKKIVIGYLKKNKNIFINFTSNIEDVLLVNYLIVLTNSGVAIEGKTIDVLNEEKILKRLGFNLPFVFDLSLQLKSYGVIDKSYTNIDRLVNDLWK